MKEAAENCMNSCFLILNEPYYSEQFKMDELGGGFMYNVWGGKKMHK